MEQTNRLELAHWVTQIAKKAGAEETCVNISNQRDVEIEYRNKKIENLQESIQNSLYIQIYIQNKYSGHSTNDLRKESLTQFVNEAVKGTKYLTSDKFRSLADAKYFPQRTDINLDIHDNTYNTINTEHKKHIVEEIESAAMAVSNKIISTSSSYGDTIYNSVMVMSNGFEGQNEGTYFSAGASVTVKDKDSRPEDWSNATTRHMKDFPSLEYLGRHAAENALQKIGQTKIKSGKYKMLVSNRSSARMISLLTEAMKGRAIQQNTSFLENMLGKKVGSNLLTIIDEPLLINGLGSRLFDSDGIAAQRRIMIENGVLTNYYIGNYYGKKLHMEPTTGSSSNLLFGYGEKSFEELVKEMHNGIIVNSFLGGNSNPTTGDFSFGVLGLLVENGIIVKPINEMNISGNATNIFHQLLAMGNDPYPYSAWKVPCMLFDEVSFSGL